MGGRGGSLGRGGGGPGFAGNVFYLHQIIPSILLRNKERGKEKKIKKKKRGGSFVIPEREREVARRMKRREKLRCWILTSLRDL